MVLALVLAAAGCSNGDIFGSSNSGRSSSSPSFGDKISSLFRNPSVDIQMQQQAQASVPPGTLPDDYECPDVLIRDGTSTYSVSAPGADASAMTLRYQASFGQTARECKLLANVLSIKVGIEGRIIVGPAGAPTQAEIPLRFAVVREGPEPKTIVSKLRWFKVDIPPGAANVEFTQIEDDLSFPAPRPNELDAYVVYVGFDRAATKEPERKKPVKPPPRTSRRQG